MPLKFERTKLTASVKKKTSGFKLNMTSHGKHDLAFVQ